MQDREGDQEHPAGATGSSDKGGLEGDELQSRVAHEFREDAPALSRPSIAPVPAPLRGTGLGGQNENAVKRSVTHQRQILSIASILVVVLLASAAVISIRAQSASNRLNRLAISADLAARASALATSDPRLAAQLALVAYKIYPTSTSEGALFEVAQDTSAVTRVIGGGSRAISALAEDQNGQDLYSASLDGTVRCWDMTSGRQLSSIAVGSPVFTLAADPQTPLLTGTDGNGDLLLWNTSGSSCLGKTITVDSTSGVDNGVQVVGSGFFHNGQRIYLLYSDGNMSTWNASTRQELDYGNLTDNLTREGIAAPSTITAASPAIDVAAPAMHSVIYVATGDQRVLAINLDTLAARVALESVNLPSMPAGVEAEPGSPNAIQVAGATGVTLWNLVTRREIESYPVDATAAGFDEDVSAMPVLTPSGLSLISLPGSTTSSASLPFEPEQLYGGATEALATPTGSGLLIAAGGADGSIAIVNPNERRLALPTAAGTTVLAFSRRGDLVLTNSDAGGNRATSLYTIHPSSTNPPLTTSSYRTVQTYSPPRSWWPAGDSFYANDAQLAGNSLFVCGQTPSGQGAVFTWNAMTARPGREIMLPGKPRLCVTIRYDQRLGLLIARDNNGQVDAWSARTWRPVMQVNTGSQAGNLDISPDGMTAAIPLEFGNENGSPATVAHKLGVINLQTHVMHEVTAPGPFYRLAYAPSGGRMAFIGYNTLQFANINGETVSREPPIQLPGLPEQLSYSPSGRLLAVTLNDGRTLIYDSGTGELAYPPIPEENGTQAVGVAWSPTGSILAIDVGRSSGQFVQVTGTELWALSPSVWAAQACTIADGNLTRTQWNRYVGTDIPYAIPCSVSRHVPSENRALDLRQVDWPSVAVPGRTCFTTGNIQLHQGQAEIRTSRYGRLSVYADNKATYGKLSGAGGDVAGLSVWCNTGGTAAGQVGQGYVIFNGSQGHLQALGIITAPRGMRNVHIPYITRIKISHGQIVAYEDSYTPRDPDCCPSGRAVTTWYYRHGRLVPGPTRVIVK